MYLRSSAVHFHFYPQIDADARGCGYVRDSFMGSRAVGAFHNRRASGILHFGRARMSENTAQG